MTETMQQRVIALVETMSVEFAAQCMRDYDICDVIVVDGTGVLCGIVTDRDIVVRAVARGLDPFEVRLGDICTRDVTAIDLSSAEREFDDDLVHAGAAFQRRA